MGVCVGLVGRVCELQPDRPAQALEHVHGVQMIAHPENAEFFDDSYLRLSNAVALRSRPVTTNRQTVQPPTAG